jgi:hypothetical protein
MYLTKNSDRAANNIAAVVSAEIWRQVERVMSKWKYDQAGMFARKDALTIRGQVKTSALHPVVNAYMSNARRIYWLWKLKPDLVEHACVLTENMCSATYDLTGHIDLVRAHAEDSDFPNKLKNKLRELVESFDNPDYMFRSQRALDRLEGLLEDVPSTWDDGVYATLSAMVTTGWTTFEVLATDLWEAALNYHPRHLSDLSGKRKRISGKAGSLGREKEEAKQEEREAVSPPDLLNVMRRVTRGTYNAGELMGTILKENFAFHKLSGVRLAYSAAFSKKSDEVDTALSNISLDKLNLVRNLLLHKSGIVDQKFLTGTKELNWTVEAEDRKTLRLDGEIVRELFSPVFQCGMDLILAVDGWVSEKSD